MDPRITTLAGQLVNYSCAVQPGEKVLINMVDHTATLLVRQIVKEVYKAGGLPFVNIKFDSITREIYMQCQVEQMDFMARYELKQMQGIDCTIMVLGMGNITELSDVPSEKMQIVNKHYKEPTSNERVDKTRWVILRYPNAAMAQLAASSTEAFEDFFFEVCNQDYAKMSRAMDPLVDLMDRTDQVRITGPDTDLTFSVKGIPSVKCDGKKNIPDGEIYTAPVKDSVNGRVAFNVPVAYEWFLYDRIYLEFKDGRVIKAEANDTARLNKCLDVDEGAGYIGEFAFGLHPRITRPMKDILFDEKIAGSFHLTPGRSYKDAYNGNDSAVHMDITCIQTPEYGGGEIYFDGVLIRKDGLFAIPELECLNPENLR